MPQLDKIFRGSSPGGSQGPTARTEPVPKEEMLSSGGQGARPVLQVAS